MKIISDKNELRKFLKIYTLSEKTIGLVATMGALHEGHFSLIDRSLKENDLTVCSIFVNPTQFNDVKDFINYPQPVLRDELALQKLGCDVLFLPSVKDIYPQGIENLSIRIGFGEIEERLEGKFRPGHFAGVGLVVIKLFNTVRPNRAYFGQKDYQQCLIVKKIVDELDFDIEIKVIETKRAADGLALSSRNERLSGTQRRLATALYESLQIVRSSWNSNKNVEQATTEGLSFLKRFSEIEPQYLEIVDKDTLLAVEDGFQKSVVICVAANIGEIRLIDNLFG